VALRSKSSLVDFPIVLWTRPLALFIVYDRNEACKKKRPTIERDERIRREIRRERQRTIPEHPCLLPLELRPAEPGGIGALGGVGPAVFLERLPHGGVVAWGISMSGSGNSFAKFCCITTLALSACAITCCAGETPSDKVQFNRDIRPIFADTCFKCHGFDKSGRKGDLRLDLPEEAIQPHKKGTPIVPGHPELSEAFQRLVSTDPDRQMPPPDSKLSLTSQQKALIKRWIAQGAVYQPHWAFVPVQRPTVPQVQDVRAVQNPIDAFVMEKLEKQGLSTSPPADRRVLIRRVTLDLTGAG
jgi:hypothetical protein